MTYLSHVFKQLLRQFVTAHLLVADCGGCGRPPSRIPRNSGPSSLAADVKVESKVDKDSVMKMMLVTEYMAVPKYFETAVGLPASILA